MDRLQSMRAFMRVVEHGGFSRAARAMDISDTVITRLVADLESHLGARLLNRTTRKLSLTETGSVYLERVRNILQEIDEADAVASSMSTKPAGTLRLFSHWGFGHYQLAKLLPRFAEANPAISLDITYSHSAADIVEAGFDVGIVLGVLQEFDTSMITRQLGITETLLVASKGYVKKNGMPTRAADLSAHKCLNYPYEQIRHHWTLRNAHDTVQVPITSWVTANSSDLLRECALADMGIFILPSFAAADDLASGRLIRILPEYHASRLPVTLIYPSRRQLSAKVRVFVDFISNQFPKPESDPWLAY